MTSRSSNPPGGVPVPYLGLFPSTNEYIVAMSLGRKIENGWIESFYLYAMVSDFHDHHSDLFPDFTGLLFCGFSCGFTQVFFSRI